MIVKGFQEYSIDTFDGEKIYYQTNFSKNLDLTKKTLILNYGLVCSFHHWKEQIPYFFHEYNILLHNYRGHYNSTGIDNIENITFKNIAIDLSLICKELQIKKATVVGHSMGVNVSLEFLKRFPEHVEKIVLISGSAIPVYNTMFHSNITDQVIPYILKIYNRFPNMIEKFWSYLEFNPIVKKLVHTGGFNLEQVSTEFIQIYLSKLGELGPQLFFQLLKQMNEHNILDYLSQIQIPTLIIGGDNDKVIPHSNQRIFASKIQDAELFTIREGSHVPQVDFPMMVNKRLKVFLKASKEV